jgi:hypothetical protein
MTGQHLIIGPRLLLAKFSGGLAVMILALAGAYAWIAHARSRLP